LLFEFSSCLRGRCFWARNDWRARVESRARSFTFEHTIYSSRELKDRLLSCGFNQVQLFGDQQGSPYGLDAQRLIAVEHR